MVTTRGGKSSVKVGNKRKKDAGDDDYQDAGGEQPEDHVIAPELQPSPLAKKPKVAKKAKPPKPASPLNVDQALATLAPTQPEKAPPGSYRVWQPSDSALLKLRALGCQPLGTTAYDGTTCL